MSNVIGIKWAITDATLTVRELAQQGGSVVQFVNNCGDGEWEHAVSYRQAVRCLEDGDVLTQPRFNPDTNYWELKMSRFAAGQEITVDIAVNADKTEIIVIKVCDQ
ncbi:MAG: hypothetical protein ABW168_17645 [Sedimenticola sp.]